MQQQQQQHATTRGEAVGHTFTMCLAKNPTEMEQNGRQTLELELELEL